MEQLKALFTPIIEAVSTSFRENPDGTIALVVIIALVVFFRARKKKKKAAASAREVPPSVEMPAPARRLGRDVSVSMLGLIAEDDSEDPDEYDPMSLQDFRRASAEYVVFDLETTGLDEDSDRIIEIGAARVRSGRIVATFSELVRADVPNGAENVNHITPAMLRKARPIEKVLPDFLAFVGFAPLAAHNARFDHAFLARACHACGLACPARVFNTFSLCSLWNTRDKKLSTLLEACGIVNTDQHRALGDAEALAQAVILSVPRIPDADMQARRAHSTEQVEAVDDRVKGLRFVLTGDVPGMERPQVERLIRLHGGRCTGSISGVTDYLVEGEYPEEGPGFVSGKKIAALEAQAQGGKIRIIPYAKLFEMIGEDGP